MYQISGRDRTNNNQVWTVQARDLPTAEHIADLFRKEGHEDVKVEETPEL